MNSDPAIATASNATDTTVPTTARLVPWWGGRAVTGVVADGVVGSSMVVT
ncbi:hypothetical protein GCM10022294_31970 [Dietzia aurantiaca]